jgi:hypothetical protein
MSGSMFPQFIGVPLEQLRVVSLNGKPIPFQIDEKTASGEYICPEGESPNTDSSNGVLDDRDELVFLFEDATIIPQGSTAFTGGETAVVCTLVAGSQRRGVALIRSKNLPRSSRRHIRYTHSRRRIETSYFYAVFGNNRFHFVNAGVFDPESGEYQDITNELRISIYLRFLWGLIPLNYTEESIVCTVKRYKCGPIRLIRRGDFHLNVGLGIKGSRAAVNQICYPQIVSVPVHVRLPIRFKLLFGDAYIEMTPVIRKEMREMTFQLPRHGISFPLSTADSIDTLIDIIPTRDYMIVQNSQTGYGWVLRTTMPEELMEKSGYIYRNPPERTGAAECGFRLTLRDLPRGEYLITNHVFFPVHTANDLPSTYRSLNRPTELYFSDGSRYTNLLTQPYH